MTPESIKEEIITEYENYARNSNMSGEDIVAVGKILSQSLDRYAKAYALSCIPIRRSKMYCGYCKGVGVCEKCSEVDGFNKALSEMRSNVEKV